MALLATFRIFCPTKWAKREWSSLINNLKNNETLGWNLLPFFSRLISPYFSLRCCQLCWLQETHQICPISSRCTVLHGFAVGPWHMTCSSAACWISAVLHSCNSWTNNGRFDVNTKSLPNFRLVVFLGKPLWKRRMLKCHLKRGLVHWKLK